jgi:hypothetical protein
MSPSAKLAIIIPYYKPDFLDPLLVFLQREVDANINVYLFDDCSPSPADAIARKYSDTIHKYLRFDVNLGRSSLTAQWDRCLSNIEQEEWIWFIPDDDVPEPGAVAQIYDAINSVASNVTLLHLSTAIIDGSGRDLGFNDTMPSGAYDAAEFYYRVLRGESMITLGSQVYSRRALNACFVEFPKGWGSDHATALKCTGTHKVVHMPDIKLQFRMSDVNISSQSDDWQQKADARVQFAVWLAAFLQPAEDGKVSFREICKAFQIKGESFFVNTCPLNWRTLRYAYEVTKALGIPFAVIYPTKITLLKAITLIRGQ